MPNFDIIFINTHQLGRVLAARHDDIPFRDQVAIGAIPSPHRTPLNFQAWKRYITRECSKSQSGTLINKDVLVYG